MYMVHWKEFSGEWFETEFDTAYQAESFVKTVISPFYDDWYVDDEAGSIVYM